MNADLVIDGTAYNVDALWREHKVAVELDGEETHGTHRAFHADRRRDTALAADGHLPLRLTHERITRERHATAAELRRILAVRSSSPWRSPITSA